MAILRILQYPDVRLNNKAEKVTEFDDHLKNMIGDMFDTLHNTRNCAGLAATQLDIKHPKHITVVYDYSKEDVSEKQLNFFCVVNGEIIEKSGEMYEPEACMSVSGVYEPVRRAEKIRLRAQNEKGDFFELEAECFMAKLLQHELDHLNGVIFIDKLSRLKRQRIDKKMAKARQGLKNK